MLEHSNSRLAKGIEWDILWAVDGGTHLVGILWHQNLMIFSVSYSRYLSWKVVIEETLRQINMWENHSKNHGEDLGPLFNSPTFFRWGNLARYFLVIFEIQPSHDFWV
jgi:hypothetical protein